MNAIMEDEPFKGYAEFHARCVALTGNASCPYPSQEFADAVMIAPDDVAIKLIEKRRTFFFPSFLAGEPMQDEINAVHQARKT
jgi:hypothetical protein